MFFFIIPFLKKSQIYNATSLCLFNLKKEKREIDTKWKLQKSSFFPLPKSMHFVPNPSICLYPKSDVL